MKISNTLYFTNNENREEAVSVALSQDLEHSVEYLNVPLAGYQALSVDGSFVRFRHPNLGCIFLMRLRNYIDITLKMHWDQAQLIITDYGLLEQYDNERMEIAIRRSPAEYEHMVIKRKDREKSKDLLWVDKLNPKTRRATVIELPTSTGSCHQSTIKFDDLVANWEITDLSLSAASLELLKNVIKSSKHLGTLTNNICDGFKTTTTNGLQANGRPRELTFDIPVFSDILKEWKNGEGKPTWFYSKISSRNQRAISLLQFDTQHQESHPQFLLHTSNMTKYWDQLPLKGYKGWYDTVNTKASEQLPNKANLVFQAESLTYNLAGNRAAFEVLMKIADSVYNIDLSLEPFFDQNAQFCIKKSMYIRKNNGFDRTERQVLTAALRGTMTAAESLVAISDPEDTVLREVSMLSLISCSPELMSIEDVHKKVFEGIDGYVAFNLEVACPRYETKNGNDTHYVYTLWFKPGYIESDVNTLLNDKLKNSAQ